MQPPAYVDHEQSVVEKYLFTPGKLSSLTNFFAKNASAAKRDEKIFSAIEAGDVKSLEYVLDNGGDPDTVFVVDTLLKSRWSALHQSCQKGDYECTKLLIKKGACLEIPDGLGQTALYYCICCEWLELMELLIKSGCNIEAYDNRHMAPLHRAVNCTTTAPLEILLKAGAFPDPRDIRKRTPLWLAASQDGKVDFIKMLLRYGALHNLIDGPEEITPLQAAIMHADKDRQVYIDLLLKHGVSVQAQSDSAPSAIQTVILRGRSSGPTVSNEDLSLVDRLIENCCNVDHVTDNAGWHFTRGSALKMAADRGCVPLIRRLIQAGANPNLTDSETSVTPLLIATKKRHVDVVKELLLANCELTTEGLLKLQPGMGVRRMNPFLCSLLQGYPEITRMLIRAGHDLTQEKYLWTSEDLPEYLTVDVEFWLWLQELISQPVRLTVIVKRFLRRNLGYTLEYKLNCVTLPPMLKKYVLNLDFETPD